MHELKLVNATIDGMKVHQRAHQNIPSNASHNYHPGLGRDATIERSDAAGQNILRILALIILWHTAILFNMH